MASLAFLIGGICYFRNNKARGARLILAGAVCLIWAISRLFQYICPHYGDVRFRQILDHFATVAAGAGIVLVFVVIIAESKRKKTEQRIEPY